LRYPLRHGGRRGAVSQPARRSTPGGPGVLQFLVQLLLTVPPFVTVRAEVSWQLAPMSRWAGLVLS